MQNIGRIMSLRHIYICIPVAISAPFNSFISQPIMSRFHLPLCLQLKSRFLGMDDAPFEDSTVYLNDAIGKVRLVG